MQAKNDRPNNSEGLQSNGVAAVGATGIPGDGASHARAGRDSCAVSPQKKPSGSVRTWSIEDVKQALRRRLLAAEQEPDEAKRAEILQKAWPLVRTIRRHGWSSPWALAAASAMGAVACGILILKTPQVRVIGMPHAQIRVIRQFNDYDFQFQKVVDGIAEPPSSWHFCHNYKPNLEVGFTLTRLTYLDRGRCVDIGPFDPAYELLRGEDDWPVIPANCRNSVDLPVVCDGLPNFERKESK